MIEAVIFDMDGVIFDTERIYLETWEKVFKDYGYNFRREVYIKCMGRGRKVVKQVFLEEFGKNLPIDVEINEYMNSRAVEILKARLLPMGLDIVFENDELDLPQVFGQEYNKNEVRYHKYDGTTYIATPDYMLSEFVKNEARNRVDEKEIGYIYIGNEGAIKEEFINEIAQEIYSEIMSMEKDEWFQRRNDEVIE